MPLSSAVRFYDFSAEEGRLLDEVLPSTYALLTLEVTPLAHLGKRSFMYIKHLGNS